MEHEQYLPIHHEEVTWDFVCNKPLPHITFILKYFMSEISPYVSQSEELLAYNERIQKKITERWSDDHKDTILFVTGCFSGLQSPKAIKRRQQTFLKDPLTLVTEKDLMFVIAGIHVGDKNEDGEYYIDTTDTEAGYLRLVARDQPEYLSNEIMQQAFNVADLDLLSDLIICDPQHQAIMLSIACPKWPAEAAEWQKRPRSFQWPPRDLIDSIVQLGCHVIPKPHRNSLRPDVEWKFSFVLAEHKLIKSLSSVQKQCYMTLETLILTELSPPYLLTPSCLRNHFFWCMEKIPEETWKDEMNGLGNAFQYVITLLLYALINANLAHYFLPERNLIDHIPEDFLDELMVKVNKLHADPISYMLNFDRVYQFSHTSSTMRMEELLKPVLDDCYKYHNILNQCYVAHSKSAHNMCKAFVQEGNFTAAYASCRTASQIDQHLSKDYVPRVLMERYLSELDDPRKELSGLEYIVKNFSDISEGLHEKMACLYTLLYCSAVSEAALNDYKRKANDSFQGALEILGAELILAIYYSVYLQKCEKAADAIPLLFRAIHKQQQRHGLSKKMLGKNCYDERIQAEFEDLEELPPLIMAFYQMIQCYIKTGQKDNAKEVMLDLNEVCLKDSQKCAFGWSLLGYANMDLDEHNVALKAFKEVLKLKPGDVQALTNIKVCELRMK
ncbi:hypothetical protein LSH36_28g03060 [Paralvinella palmiformis]|uniref:Mab-21-like HhH/H2TH-like domain-containing protein n=1 Tax=Paralvinella palmiformis TaxID=53620 RepID=A0AAD9K9R2_9ANNE|nr:hypothetical protein LSH36_28g03060 [Paralvinella palmiformis]